MANYKASQDVPKTNLMTFDNLIDIDIKADPPQVVEQKGETNYNPFDVQDLLDMPATSIPS